MFVKRLFSQRQIKSLSLIFLVGLLLVVATGCFSTNETAERSSQTAAQAVASQSALPQLMVYRTPTCGCCGVWVERMQAQGFEIQDNVVDGAVVDEIKAEYGLPQNLQGCHSAVVGDYLVEGHVPAGDIARLLTEKPEVAGITVPGMPIGSPGMESGDLVEPYASLTFDTAGNTAVFQEHGV